MQVMRVLSEIFRCKNSSYPSNIMMIVKSFALNVHQILGEVLQTMAGVSL